MQNVTRNCLQSVFTKVFSSVQQSVIKDESDVDADNLPRSLASEKHFIRASCGVTLWKQDDIGLTTAEYINVFSSDNTFLWQEKYVSSICQRRPRPLAQGKMTFLV